MFVDAANRHRKVAIIFYRRSLPEAWCDRSDFDQQLILRKHHPIWPCSRGPPITASRFAASQCECLTHGALWKDQMRVRILNLARLGEIAFRASRAAGFLLSSAICVSGATKTREIASPSIVNWHMIFLPWSLGKTLMIRNIGEVDPMTCLDCK